MSNEGEIPIGQFVIDLVSNLQGTSITRCVFLNGCIQHEVQPDLEEDEMQKTVWIDEAQLKIHNYQDDRIQKITMGSVVKLGYFFEDIVTKLTGVAVAYAEHHSGLREYEIQPITDRGDGRRKQSIWIPKNRLIEIEEFDTNRESIAISGAGIGGGHRSHP